MRKAPLNYLITLAAGGVLWVVTGIFGGNYLADTVSLANFTTELFLRVFRVVMVAAATAGVLNSFYWYFFGTREGVASAPARSRRVWRVSLVAQVAAATAAIVAIIVTFSGERFTPTEYLILIGGISLHTWVFFWLCTLAMSPRANEYAVLGRG